MARWLAHLTATHGPNIAANVSRSGPAAQTMRRFTLTADTIQVVEVGARYQFTPALYVAVAYALMLPNHDSTNVILRGNRNQFGATVDDAFSKRTDV